MKYLSLDTMKYKDGMEAAIVETGNWMSYGLMAGNCGLIS